jgi:hypothetical protein
MTAGKSRKGAYGRSWLCLFRNSLERNRMKARRLICMVVPVVAALAPAAGPASASPLSGFQASIKSVNPLGNPQPCMQIHTICGTADVAGYGPASWTFDVSSLSNYGDPTPQCATYAASGEFVLTDGGGTLIYDEIGTVCAPGNSVLAPRRGIFNPPWTVIAGKWKVDGGTGAFTGATGRGTDSAKITGPEARGTYTSSS